MVGIPLGDASSALFVLRLLSNLNSLLLYLFAGLVMFQSIGERVNRLSRWVEEQTFGRHKKRLIDSINDFLMSFLSLQLCNTDR